MLTMVFIIIAVMITNCLVVHQTSCSDWPRRQRDPDGVGVQELGQRQGGAFEIRVCQLAGSEHDYSNFKKKSAWIRQFSQKWSLFMSGWWWWWWCGSQHLSKKMKKFNSCHVNILLWMMMMTTTMTIMMNISEYHSILSRWTSSRTALSIFSTLDDDDDNDDEYDEYDEYHSIL